MHGLSPRWFPTPVVIDDHGVRQSCVDPESAARSSSIALAERVITSVWPD
jgi:hypothetical protein